jgi:capsular polysaccharide biosynthesis protein
VTPHFVHPGLRDVWARLRAGLPPGNAPKADRLFVSRRPGLGNRQCRNVADVEQVFADQGFTVVYPEELPLADQASLFAHATVVAGFAGSALYNLVFAERVQHLVVLAHEAYTARYEHLFASVLGCAADYFWSTPDIPHPPRRWSADAYYSAWEFDFDRNGADLRAVLERLPG